MMLKASVMWWSTGPLCLFWSTREDADSGSSCRAETVIRVDMRTLETQLWAVGLWDCVRLKGDPAAPPYCWSTQLIHCQLLKARQRAHTHSNVQVYTQTHAHTNTHTCGQRIYAAQILKTMRRNTVTVQTEQWLTFTVAAAQWWIDATTTYENKYVLGLVRSSKIQKCLSFQCSLLCVYTSVSSFLSYFETTLLCIASCWTSCWLMSFTCVSSAD